MSAPDAYGVKHKGHLVAVCITEGGAQEYARILDGGEIVPLTIADTKTELGDAMFATLAAMIGTWDAGNLTNFRGALQVARELIAVIQTNQNTVKKSDCIASADEMSTEVQLP